MLNKLAQIPLGPADGFKGFGPLGLENKTTEESSSIFQSVLSMVIGVMTVIAIIWFVIQFFLGAIGIVFSGGDKGKLAEARTKIMTGIIGITVVISAVFLIDLVGSILGIENILGIDSWIQSLAI